VYAELSARFSASCNVCDSRRIRRYDHRIARMLPFFDFFECKQCGLVFVHPLPDTSFYAEGKLPDFPTEEAWVAPFVDCAERHAGGRGSMLEVGIGSGGFLAEAHRRGWDVHGVDLSEATLEHAREKLGLPNIHRGPLSQVAFPDGRFDVVAAFNLLEHVPDPRKTLLEFSRVLRPGGLVVLLCPNISAAYDLLVQEVLSGHDPLHINWIPPEHLYYFNHDTLRRLLSAVGLEVIADESSLTTALWAQHAERIGSHATDPRWAELVDRINRSPLPRGDGRLREHWADVARLVSNRVTWSLVSDVVELEKAGGAENACLLVARKPGN
jgi:ubiquinone/menaquinone biosynthesis C-methylase UbiE